MASLITMEEAKDALRVLDNDHDSDIELRMHAASEMVLQYANQSDPAWTDETAPYLIKAAIILTLQDLFSSEEPTGLTEGVKNILHRWRDPVLA